MLLIPDRVFDLTRLAIDDALHAADTIMRQVEILAPAEVVAALDIRRPIDSAVEQLRDARLARATAAMRFKNDLEPMEIETARLMQKEADDAYDRGVQLIENGKLKIHISRELTLGNYVDGQVRTALRYRFLQMEIDAAGKGPVRVNRREVETSGDERTYRRPDARVGDVAFDVTLTAKTHKTLQIGGFFRSDFRPRFVIIIRPKQLGAPSSYVLTSPEMKK